MSLLDRLKDALVEDDKQPVAQKPVPAPAPAIPFHGTAMSFNGVTVTQQYPPTPEIPVSEQRSAGIESLRAKVHPTSGPLVTFLAMLESLKPDIPDESTRYHVVQKALSAQGISINDVVVHYQATLDRLRNEVKKFVAAKAVKAKAEVEDRQKQIATVSAEVDQLSQQIRDKLANRESIQQALNAAQSKINEAELKFTAVQTTLVNEYQDALRKTQLYLGGIE
jgi:hypothetical protein